MKILIVKTSSLGDIIHAFPILDYLKEHYPEAQIDWAVEKPFRGLLEAHPHLTNVISIETKKWRRAILQKRTWSEIFETIKKIRSTHYDLLIDLQGNTKSGLFTFFAISKSKIGFGRTTVSEWPNLLFTRQRFNPPPGKNIRDDYLFLVESVVKKSPVPSKGIGLIIDAADEKRIEELLRENKLQGGPKMMVCPGSNWDNKRLSKETLQAFLDEIHVQLNGRFLFIWGSLDEKKTCEELAAYFQGVSLVCDRLHFPVLQNLMGRMDLVIAMDSLPLHLAGTTSTPTYSFFGPSLADKYQPAGPRHYSFQGACPYDRTFEKRCPILRSCVTGSCLKDVDAPFLYNHFNKWWKGLQKKTSTDCSF